uniref:Uncharacterized protein n=1 Tax=Plectus sambesii TaxID=2011161 RepID=A0A914VXX3_9BILA
MHAGRLAGTRAVFAYVGRERRGRVRGRRAGVSTRVCFSAKVARAPVGGTRGYNRSRPICNIERASEQARNATTAKPGRYKGRTEGGRRDDDRINRDRVAAARQNDRRHEYMILAGAPAQRSTAPPGAAPAARPGPGV